MEVKEKKCASPESRDNSGGGELAFSKSKSSCLSEKEKVAHMVEILNREPSWRLFTQFDPQGIGFISACDFIRVLLSSLVLSCLYWSSSNIK
jgi:hypothetical protein